MLLRAWLLNLGVGNGLRGIQAHNAQLKRRRCGKRAARCYGEDVLTQAAALVGGNLKTEQTQNKHFFCCQNPQNAYEACPLSMQSPSYFRTLRMQSFVFFHVDIK